MSFGGLKSIPQDYDYISTTAASVFVTNEGDFIYPIGIWAIGSTMRTGHAKGYLHGKQVIREDHVLYLADSQADLQILVASEDKLFIYQSGNRMWQPMEEGSLYYGLNVDMETANKYIAAAKNGSNLKPWAVVSTHIDRY
jgi:hypothetical protein